MTAATRWAAPIDKLTRRATVVWNRARFSETERIVIWQVWLESVLSYVPVLFEPRDATRVLNVMRKWCGGNHYHSLHSRVTAELVGAPTAVLQPVWRNVVRLCRLALCQITGHFDALTALRQAMRQGVSEGVLSQATARALVDNSVVSHLDSALRRFRCNAGVSAQDMLRDMRLHLGF